MPQRHNTLWSQNECHMAPFFAVSIFNCTRICESLENGCFWGIILCKISNSMKFQHGFMAWGAEQQFKMFCLTFPAAHHLRSPRKDMNHRSQTRDVILWISLSLTSFISLSLTWVFRGLEVVRQIQGLFCPRPWVVRDDREF